ncbi:uncharacterized protein LOC107615313 [Arachis ipaensis]|uniref:uncharacterized protein LOC107615313 n=1 Tax=Arachis ipaensis TaxID=130454 RepID=UPI0007AF4D37|nr:uncharacterized protein LOC107615313 [Arachis ipaensis]
MRGGPRVLSNHCPMIVEDTRVSGSPRPFRSLDSWFTYEGFLRMVKEEWRSLRDYQFTSKLTIPLRKWHRENFGDMDDRIKRFEDEIKKIDDMIDREEATALEVMPFAAKIKKVVWDCESTKAPGNGRYNMNFIKKYWDEIGKEFTPAVIGFFESAKLPTDANVMYVALVPKFAGAKEIKDLQLISMVGCEYKVISKVLVKRMRSVISGLVGETHNAFVKGQKKHNKALIACETVQ